MAIVINIAVGLFKSNNPVTAQAKIKYFRL